MLFHLINGGFLQILYLLCMDCIWCKVTHHNIIPAVGLFTISCLYLQYNKQNRM